MNYSIVVLNWYSYNLSKSYPSGVEITNFNFHYPSVNIGYLWYPIKNNRGFNFIFKGDWFAAFHFSSKGIPTPNFFVAYPIPSPILPNIEVSACYSFLNKRSNNLNITIHNLFKMFSYE